MVERHVADLLPLSTGSSWDHDASRTATGPSNQPCTRCRVPADANRLASAYMRKLKAAGRHNLPMRRLTQLQPAAKRLKLQPAIKRLLAVLSHVGWPSRIAYPAGPACNSFSAERKVTPRVGCSQTRMNPRRRSHVIVTLCVTGSSQACRHRRQQRMSAMPDATQSRVCKLLPA